MICILFSLGCLITGGTIDITVHEIDSSGGLKEVTAASGGDWGGIMVDEEFKNILTNLLGMRVYEKFVKTETEDWLDFWRSFEVKKKTIDPTSKSKITITLCQSLRDLCEENGRAVEEVIAESKYASDIEASRDKVRIDCSLMQSLFSKSIEKTVSHVKSVLRHDNTRDTQAILMVGGFSESPMLQEAIKNEFSDLQIIIPKEASTAIMRGAVIFGHNPTSIQERVLKKTYGKRVCCPFNGDVHDEKYKINTDTGPHCDLLFAKFVEIGQSIKIGEKTQMLGSKPLWRNQKLILTEFYASDLKNPKYVDQGCQRIGSLKVDLSDVPGDLDRKVYTSLTFGETEIMASCKVEKTGQVLTAKLDFLG